MASVKDELSKAVAALFYIHAASYTACGMCGVRIEYEIGVKGRAWRPEHRVRRSGSREFG